MPKSFIWLLASLDYELSQKLEIFLTSETKSFFNRFLAFAEKYSGNNGSF